MAETHDADDPDDVKVAFNATFEGQNKSALIADLMREAVERAKQKKASEAAYLCIVKRRKNAPVVSIVHGDSARFETAVSLAPRTLSELSHQSSQLTPLAAATPSCSAPA